MFFMKHVKPKTAALLLFIESALFLTSCAGASSAYPITKTGFAFDTVISITIYDSQKSAVLDECLSLCERYDTLFSATREDSEIWQLNHRGKEPTDISFETASLIQAALYWCEQSGGALDLTMLPVSEAWNIAGQMTLMSENPDYEYVIPDTDTLNALLSHVNYKNVVLYDEAGTVVGYEQTLSHDTQYSAAILDTHAAIDLGFIAKGYIADRLKEVMLSSGIESGIISLGGNILLIGAKPDGSPFRVGIQKPFGNAGESIVTLQKTDMSVVSSGCYERYFIADDGSILHHILDTATGAPVQNELYGVTILSGSSLQGDALSTCCYILGLEKGLELVNSLDGIEAVFITSDYEVITTPGCNVSNS
ncbi:MAG: FAD:protein FMN transferase [Lachnospiraceae bacterium]|nr:FAD:protein FMN transferase [Lachnospiraceae bacterium]